MLCNKLREPRRHRWTPKGVDLRSRFTDSFATRVRFGGQVVADRLQQMLVVEPIDAFGGMLDDLEGYPRSKPAGNLGLEGPDHAPGGGSAVGVTDAADGGPWCEQAPRPVRPGISARVWPRQGPGRARLPPTWLAGRNSHACWRSPALPCGPPRQARRDRHEGSTHR